MSDGMQLIGTGESVVVCDVREESHRRQQWCSSRRAMKALDTVRQGTWDGDMSLVRRFERVWRHTTSCL